MPPASCAGQPDPVLGQGAVPDVLWIWGSHTEKTATVIQIGDYATSTKVRPHAIGKSAFFTSEIGGFTIAREFFLGAATDDRLLSSDLTIQCPQYVKGNARYIQA